MEKSESVGVGIGETAEEQKSEDALLYVAAIALMWHVVTSGFVMECYGVGGARRYCRNDLTAI